MAAAYCVAAAAVGAQTAVEEPATYREDEFRAPVPATLQGARVVTTLEAERLWREKAAIFIDVLPRAPKPPTLPKGTIWRDKPRFDIPGSIWLVNVGYGGLSPQMETYFKEGLRLATGGDKTRPILFYCLADCWMSWNAAKRALEYGYSDVIWFPDGTDGWEAHSLVELERREPEPLPN